MTKLVILDRDGVINADSPEYIKSASEWVALPHSLEAIAKLGRAGFTVIVASNQSGLGRGLFDADALASIHDKMLREVRHHGGDISAIYFCPHRPDEGCECRKPRPGLLQQIANDRQISMRDVPIIGDSARDLDAARSVGARPILVLTGNGRKTLASGAQVDEVFEDLEQAADALISEY